MTSDAICILKTLKFIFVVSPLSELQTHMSWCLPPHFYLFKGTANLHVTNWTSFPPKPVSFSPQVMTTLFSQLLKLRYLESFLTLLHLIFHQIHQSIFCWLSIKCIWNFNCFLLFLLLTSWSSLSWMSLSTHYDFLLRLSSHIFSWSLRFLQSLLLCKCIRTQ